ncbi:MAG: protoporphyrinogen oxidase, partial [Acidimicrobiales bacterium]
RRPPPDGGTGRAGVRGGGSGALAMSHPAATGAPPVVAVVGGGITGLAGALALADGGARVVLLEASGRLGGKIRTEDFGGQPVEAGPDAFLARVPHAVELCKRLGLADDLVSPATGKASLWVRGRLRPLPSGLVLGVPTRWAPLARSGILSPAGLARAVLDLVMPASAAPEDRSVGDLVGSRLGSQVADRLVGPLVGGINAGDAATLSAAAAAPVLDAAARRSRSLVLGLRHPPTAAPAPAAARFGPVCGPQATTNTTSSAPAPAPAAPAPAASAPAASAPAAAEAAAPSERSPPPARPPAPVGVTPSGDGDGWSPISRSRRCRSTRSSARLIVDRPLSLGCRWSTWPSLASPLSNMRRHWWVRPDSVLRSRDNRCLRGDGDWVGDRPRGRTGRANVRKTR